MSCFYVVVPRLRDLPSDKCSSDFCPDYAVRCLAAIDLRCLAADPGEPRPEPVVVDAVSFGFSHSLDLVHFRESPTDLTGLLNFSSCSYGAAFDIPTARGTYSLPCGYLFTGYFGPVLVGEDGRIPADQLSLFALFPARSAGLRRRHATIYGSYLLQKDSL